MWVEKGRGTGRNKVLKPTRYIVAGLGPPLVFDNLIMHKLKKYKKDSAFISGCLCILERIIINESIRLVMSF